MKGLRGKTEARRASCSSDSPDLPTDVQWTPSCPPVSLKTGAPSISSAREVTMTTPHLARWPAMSRAPLGSRRCSASRRFRCAWCEKRCGICRSCDRGQKYCGPDCRREARLAAQREASRCYQSTEIGRAHHAERSARYRRRQRERAVASDGVTQQGLVFSDPECRLSSPPSPACCAVCNAPLQGKRSRCVAVRRVRRAALWTRRSPTEFLTWSTTSWSCATRICVSAGRRWKLVCWRVWSETASSCRWWRFRRPRGATA